MEHLDECTVTTGRAASNKVRKGGDFFYGKPKNPYHIKSL